MGNWYDNEDRTKRRRSDLVFRGVKIGLVHSLVFKVPVAMAASMAPAFGTQVSAITVIGIAGTTVLGATTGHVTYGQRLPNGDIEMHVPIIQPLPYA